MAELRVKETGTIKLFESDNTSSVTIASPASLGADRTITLPDASVTLASGTMLATDGSGASLTALNASELGSGTVPTARLGSGTASSSTVLYGDQTYKAEPGGGKLGQIVQATTNTIESTTAGSYTEYTGTTVSITPTATSSKVYLLFSGTYKVTREGASQSYGTGFIAIYRGVTQLGTSVMHLGNNYGVNTWGDHGGGWTMCLEDSPSTTSATTYKIYYYADGTTLGMYLPFGGYIQMSAMEILA
jgi:hypothetical protein